MNFNRALRPLSHECAPRPRAGGRLSRSGRLHIWLFGRVLWLIAAAAIIVGCDGRPQRPGIYLSGDAKVVRWLDRRSAPRGVSIPFRIANNTGETITTLQVNSQSCGCFSVTLPPTPIPAASTREGALKIAGGLTISQQYAVSLVAVTSSSREYKSSHQVCATVLPRWSVAPSVIIVGPAKNGGAVPSILAATRYSSPGESVPEFAPIQLAGIPMWLQHSPFRKSGERKISDDAIQVEYRAELRASGAAPGSKPQAGSSGAISLLTDDGTSFSVQYQVATELPPVSPTYVGFGDVPVGEVSERTITVLDDSLARSRIKVRSSLASVRAIVETQNADHAGQPKFVAIRVVFAPVARGRYEGKINIFSGLGGGVPTATVGIGGRGIDPPPTAGD